MEEEQVESEIVDVSLQDGTYRRREWKMDNKHREQVQHGTLPEEVLSQIAEYMGDGAAKITVGAELSHNKDYCTAKSFVSISVHCGNDEESLGAVHSIIHEMAKKLVKEDLAVMMEERNALLAPAKKPETVTAGPPRPAAVNPIPRVAPKTPPSFRR